MLSLPEICTSRYLLFTNLCDCGFDAGKASQAVDVLLGPEPAEEPYEPSEADLADYREWCQEVDARWYSDRMDRDEFTYEDDAHVTDADVMTATGAIG